MSDSQGRPGWFSRYVWSLDHKTIGIQFLVFSMLMLLFGLASSLAIRWQLAWPWTQMPVVGRALFPETGGVPTPEFYTVLFTIHGSVMIFFVVIPLLTGWLGNYLIPLMIGAGDMAFPRLNALSFWLMPPAAIAMLAGFWSEGGAASAGWTAYPPLSTSVTSTAGGAGGQTWWLVSITLSGIASTLGAINYITTIVKLRAPGLDWFRLPLTVWALFIAAILQLAGLPVLTAGGLMQLSDRHFETQFFSAQGAPILWQHLFWFYGHPAVYVVILPAMGVVSDVLSVHARKGVFGYRPMVYSMLAIAGLGFLVWGHHMFVSGMNPSIALAFEISTTLIALPSGVKVFNWLATLWGSRIRFTAAMLFALGFVALFITGGLSGLWLTSTPVDVYVHDTYVVVGHFHYIVFGGSVFGLFAAFYHWFPKMTGRMMHEGLGKLHFAGTFLLTSGVFLLMHQIGIAGMLRRTADPYVYESFAHLREPNQLITLSAILLALWQLLFFVNVAWSLRAGRRVGSNPWQANSLEWESDSPPGHGNFSRTLVVEAGPYEYQPGRTEGDNRPQARTISAP